MNQELPTTGPLLFSVIYISERSVPTLAKVFHAFFFVIQLVNSNLEICTNMSYASTKVKQNSFVIYIHCVGSIYNINFKKKEFYSLVNVFMVSAYAVAPPAVIQGGTRSCMCDNAFRFA